MPTSYRYHPLVLPLDDGGDDFEAHPLIADNRLDFAERFRRQGQEIYPSPSRWGVDGQPAKLTLRQVSAINRKVWTRDKEPIDLSGYTPWSTLPHGRWKWRIYVEPKGLAGALYEIDNPAAPGEGASIMAEGLMTKDGDFTDLPMSFSAPGAGWQRMGGLQCGYTTDGGTTIVWCNPIWD